MEFIFTLFDLAADGVAGRRWKRRAAACVGVVVFGIGLELGAAGWLFGEYVDFWTSAAERLLHDVVDQVEVPSTERN